MTPKERKNKLIEYADEAVRSTLLQNGLVDGTYDGQISAFSVAVALSGLKTAMAIYMKSESGSTADRKKVIRMLAKMKNADEQALKELKKVILEYAIALKLTFRTFKYRKNER